jgi:hypothetical protein
VSARCYAAAFLVFSGAAAGAQKPATELWPELDIYWTPAVHQRTFLELSSSADREGPEREDTIGLYQDYLMLPAGYLRGGFRYTFSTNDNSYREYRFVGEGTYTVWARGLARLVNRSRLEIRDVNTAWSYRVRDRLHLQRLPVKDKGLALAPYATFEAYYYSQYKTIARVGGRVGSEAHIYGPAWIDLYFARQDNTRTLPKYVNAIGLTAKLTY